MMIFRWQNKYISDLDENLSYIVVENNCSSDMSVRVWEVLT